MHTVSFGRAARSGAVLATVGTINVAAWAAYGHAADAGAQLPDAGLALSGAAAVAYGLGLRHGMDADHLAAIDDSTRLLVSQGKDPAGTGMFFALGHSVIVLALGAGVAGAAHAISPEALGLGEELGSALVAVFLIAMGVLNASVWRDLRRAERTHAAGGCTPEEVAAVLRSRGLMNRLTRGRSTSRLVSSPGMFFVGVLFGLGLGTASEILLLTSATAVAAPELGSLAIMSLPLLFVAGMVTTDTLDGLFMSRLYGSAALTPARSLRLSLMTTGLTVVITLGVAAIYLAAIAVDAGLTALEPVAELRADFIWLGAGVIACYLAIWGGSAVMWRSPGGSQSGRSATGSQVP